MADRASWSALRADVRRYRADAWVSRWLWWIAEQSFWAVAAYRIGNLLREALPAPVRGPVVAVYNITVLPLINILTRIEIPLEARIGPGLRIYHGNGLVMGGDVVIGANCTLRQGCNIGGVLGHEKMPRIGDGVDVGAYSQILGDVTVGDDARIGPHTLVLRNVPAGATAFGVPARVTSQRETAD